jgi:hypothetical protein
METDIENAINELISRSKHILSLSECTKVNSIAGINKFRRKVKKELLFLEGVLDYSIRIKLSFIYYVDSLFDIILIQWFCNVRVVAAAGMLTYERIREMLKSATFGSSHLVRHSSTRLRFDSTRVQIFSVGLHEKINCGCS